MLSMGNKLRSISVKLPVALDRQLADLARKRHADKSTVIREALLHTVASETDKVSIVTAAGELAGALSGPRDLSTSARHLDDY